MNTQSYIMINNSVVIIPKTKYSFNVIDSSSNSFSNSWTNTMAFSPIDNHIIVPPRNTNPIPQDPQFLSDFWNDNEILCENETSDSCVDNSNEEMIFYMDDFC